MSGSKITCDTVKDYSRILKARAVLTVFVIIFFVCSLQVASLRHHDDSLIIHRACHICKFLALSSSGSEMALLQITAADSTPLFLALENLLIFLAVLPLVRGTRAPPHLLFALGRFRMNGCLQDLFTAKFERT
jgi:hypothetical protein